MSDDEIIKCSEHTTPFLTSLDYYNLAAIISVYEMRRTEEFSNPERTDQPPHSQNPDGLPAL